jgi:hypothetical protein
MYAAGPLAVGPISFEENGHCRASMSGTSGSWAGPASYLFELLLYT